MASRNFLGKSRNLILDMPHLRSFLRPSQHAFYSQMISGAQRDLGVDEKKRISMEWIIGREGKSLKKERDLKEEKISGESHGRLELEWKKGKEICEKKMWRQQRYFETINVKGLGGKTVKNIRDQSGKAHLGVVRYRLVHVITQVREKGG